MKSTKTNVFIVIASLSLIVLLCIQVQWLFQTAKVKEELFNEKANIVLSRTTEELCSDSQMCENMGNCLADSLSECKLMLGKNEIAKIDSLLNHFMVFYNFHLDYSFEVIKPNHSMYHSAGVNTGNNIFKKRLEEVVNKNGLELKLVFPDKKKFIMEEMGVMFITSVLLILIIIIFFWQTIRSLWKEKMISERTTDFLNNMTHEFKTPLTNIGLAGKMINKETSLGDAERIKHYSSIILEENEKLSRQVEQVLSMVSLERGEIPLIKCKVSFHDIITNAQKCISVQIEATGGSLKTNLEAEKYFIDGDKTHLTNAICNLIDNAIKYAKDKPEITIKTFNADGKINFRIEDRGIGIEKRFHANVFDKYFRVSTGDIHNVKGFGLGLAYVKRIIELHGGSIKVESEINVNSVFTITLPLNHE